MAEPDPDQAGKRARERATFESEPDEFGHPLIFESHIDGRLVETYTGPGPSMAYLRHLAEQPRPPATPAAPRPCNRCLAAPPLRGMRWCGPCAIRANQEPAAAETAEEARARGETLRYLTARVAAAAAGHDATFAPAAGDFDLAELIEVYEDAGDLEITPE